MGEFSRNLTNYGRRGVISPWDEGTPYHGWAMIVNAGYNTGTGAWTANGAAYAPVVVRQTVTITDFLIEVMTQNGNVDVGLYTWDGILLVSNGGVACGAAGGQVLTCTDTTVPPGWYRLGFSSHSSSAVFRNASNASANMRVNGFQQQSSAYPLPSTATFANVNVDIAPAVCAGYRSVL